MPAPRPLTLCIDQAILAALVADADRELPNETGGILLGYRAGDDVFVQIVVGAGPRAQRWRTGFKPDNDYQTAEIAKAFEETDGHIEYLGDWHTHPDAPPRPSRRDRRTLRNIARHADALCPVPVMLILSPTQRQGWHAAGWTGRLGRFAWGRAIVEPAHLRMNGRDSPA